jgi:hypothetical protein
MKKNFCELMFISFCNAEGIIWLDSGGTYSGTLTISRTGYHVGSIYVAPKTSIYSPKGKFSIY